MCVTSTWKLLSLFAFLSCFAEKQLVVFIRPVVDLITTNFQQPEQRDQLLKAYAPDRPVCWFPRLFQALFGEMAFWDDANAPIDGYVCVELCNCYFATKTGGIQPLRYWARRTDLLRFDELSDRARKLFPEPIFYQKPSSVHAASVVTLAEPWTSKATRKTYSAGTRFLAYNSNKAKAKKITVVFYDPVTGSRVFDQIPRYRLVQGGRPIPFDARRGVFIDLLMQWSDSVMGIVPYVWGGASYLERLSDNEGRLVDGMIVDKNVRHWIRGGRGQVSGFDCSGLVLRAAQACGIPYFCRTSSTAGALLDPVKTVNELESGDLCVTHGHGHIFVIAGDGKIIEAAGYGSRYGRVQCTAVGDRFLNAQSYGDLVALCVNGSVPLYRKKNGDPDPSISSGFVIVKLPA